MRIARDLGDTALLLPSGIEHIDDLPHTIFDAIRRALVFLSWEELETEYRPPHKIWMENDLLNEHFKWVKADRERKYGGKSDIADEPIKGPVSQNKLTRSYIRNRR